MSLRSLRYSIQLAFCCCFIAAMAYGAELTVNKIAAVVNGEMITMHELNRHIAMEMARKNIPLKDESKRKEVQADVLDSMINDILIRQEAKRFKVSVSDTEVEGELQKAINRSGIAPDKFDAELKRQGTTRELYKERIGDMLLRQRMANFMVTRKVFVKPEEVEEYYNKNKDKMVGEKTADFSIMLLPEKLPIKDIYEQLRSGKLSFEDAARKYSMDSSAAEGGKISGIPWDRLPPDMHRLLSSLKNGQMSPPLRTQGGFVLIRRDGLTEAKALSFQEAVPRIEETLRAPLLEERFKEYTSQLRSKAVIDIRL